VRVVAPAAVGGKGAFCICERVKFTALLTYQLQFKAGSDLDKKLSKKMKVIKHVVCDSVNEKTIFSEKTMILALAWWEETCFAGKVSF